MRTFTAVKIGNVVLPNSTKLLHFQIVMNYVNIVKYS